MNSKLKNKKIIRSYVHNFSLFSRIRFGHQRMRRSYVRLLESSASAVAGGF